MDATHTTSPASAATERRRLARAIHDRVLQQLCGISIALDAARALEPHERDRCKRELDTAIAALRDVLENALQGDPFGPTLRGDGERPPATLAHALAIARAANPAVAIRCERDRQLSPDLAVLVRDFAAEGIRNALKHGDPTAIEIEAAAPNGTLSVSIENDRARPGRHRGTELGLRSLELEAFEHGGRLDAGPQPDGRWSARLELPLD